MNRLTTFFRRLRPTPDPEGKVEAKRIALKRDTIRASQQGGLGQLGSFGNVPPTPGLLEPKRDD